MKDAGEQAVQRAIDTMRGHLGEQLTVDDLARAALFSRFHFTRVFRRVTGVSPKRFLSGMRLERAKYLLTSTSMNVVDVSAEVGYSSVGTFSTRFNRSVGMPPTAYRRRSRLAVCPHTTDTRSDETEPLPRPVECPLRVREGAVRAGEPTWYRADDVCRKGRPGSPTGD